VRLPILVKSRKERVFLDLLEYQGGIPALGEKMTEGGLANPDDPFDRKAAEMGRRRTHLLFDSVR
jgi:hypothetical protein